MAKSLFNELGLSRKDGRELVDLLIDELAASLAVAEQVKLSGFENLNFGIKTNVQAEIQKPVRAFRYPHDVW